MRDQISRWINKWKWNKKKHDCWTNIWREYLWLVAPERRINISACFARADLITTIFSVSRHLSSDAMQCNATHIHMLFGIIFEKMLKKGASCGFIVPFMMVWCVCWHTKYTSNICKRWRSRPDITFAFRLIHFGQFLTHNVQVLWINGPFREIFNLPFGLYYLLTHQSYVCVWFIHKRILFFISIVSVSLLVGVPSNDEGFKFDTYSYLFMNVHVSFKEARDCF